MNKLKAAFWSLMLTVSATSAHAQDQIEMADQMRSNGKIYVVVGIILIIFVGLIAYLVALDRKVSKLEKKLPK
ncbi:MAG: CcmD family protein [Cyclobacteriaceae bacterium]